MTAARITWICRIRTTRTAAYDSKNRHDLPDSRTLAWDDYAAALKAHRPADPKALREQIALKAHALGGEIETYSAQFVVQYNNDAVSLSKLNNRLNAKMAAVETTAKEGE